MALGPRLDLRQTQALVMTPQLRQAIKLLQFSNVEVASFIEEELERNPLLERDDSAEMPNTERAAPDQGPERISEAADAAQLVHETSTSTNAASRISPMSVARCANISVSSCDCRSTIRWIA
jgi:RNA polymerase sigma-54 factor